jgi:hypothetical protein
LIQVNVTGLWWAVVPAEWAAGATVPKRAVRAEASAVIIDIRRSICILYGTFGEPTWIIYANRLSCCGCPAVASAGRVSCARFLTAPASKRTKTMLDVAYILLGAVFLGACVLYVFTCDRL